LNGASPAAPYVFMPVAKISVKVLGLSRQPIETLRGGKEFAQKRI
jgi:hypothetical protein